MPIRNTKPNRMTSAPMPKPDASRNSVPVAPAGIGSSLAYGLTMTACDGVEYGLAIMNLLRSTCPWPDNASLKPMFPRCLCYQSAVREGGSPMTAMRESKFVRCAWTNVPTGSRCGGAISISTRPRCRSRPTTPPGRGCTIPASRCGSLAPTSTASFWASCTISITARAGRSATTAICRTCSWRKSARKLGLGRALIEAVYREARAAGASRVHWLTHETNATARALYDTLADRPGFIQYRKVFLTPRLRHLRPIWEDAGKQRTSVGEARMSVTRRQMLAGAAAALAADAGARAGGELAAAADPHHHSDLAGRQPRHRLAAARREDHRAARPVDRGGEHDHRRRRRRLAAGREVARPTATTWRC